MKKHILTLRVKNKHGVLSRVAGIFNRRGFNIDSFSSGQIDDGIYRMTIVLSGDTQTIELMKKQLNKLIDVMKVVELDEDHLEMRELLMIKMSYNTASIEEITQTAEVYCARMVKDDKKSRTYQLTAVPAEIDAFIEQLQHHEILAVNRSGAVAIE